MYNKRIGNSIFKVILIILLILSLFLNNDYRDIKDRKLINNEDTYNKYKNSTYVSFDLSNATETRFMVESDKKYKTYLVNYNNNNILVILSPNTVLTKEVNLMKMKDNNYSVDVKESYKKENPDTNYISGYYTNNNLQSNERIVNIKLIATYVFILILSIFILIDIVLLIRSKTKIKEENLNIKE